jgi:transcriptional regulator with XRE-family HTH domain
LTSPESPAGARRRVRLALREARERLGYTQSAVAEAMDWSHSKVIRIESGEVTISPNDLRPLLAHLGITSKATVDKLIQDARASRRRQMWWDDPSIKANLTPASRSLIQYEMEAVEIRHFTNIMIPGPLQTTAYSESILSGHHDELAAEAIRVRLETRGRRRRELLARRNFPKIFLLLEESVLKRRIHNARTTGEQLLDLLRLSKEKPISLRVLPYTADAPLPVMGPFDLLTLTTGTDEVMYRESHLIDELAEDPSTVKRHHRIFETWWDAALSETESAKLIAESANELIGTSSTEPQTSQTGTNVTDGALSTAKAVSGASRRRRPTS